MLYSAPVFLLCFFTGYSGITYITDILNGLFEVILTTWAIDFYLLFEQDVSFRDSWPDIQSNGRFPDALLPALYSYKIETHLSKKYKRFLWWSLYTWYSSAIMFFIPFYAMNDIVNRDGKVGSLWESGITSFTILIMAHHGTVFIGTRNYTWPVVLVYIFSLSCFMPITLLLNEYDPGSNTYRTVFKEIMGDSPLFWFCSLLSTAAICLPIYAAKAYEMVLNSPEYYQLRGRKQLVFN